MIYKFCRKEVQQSSKGYYVTTLEAAIEEISNLDAEKLLRLQNTN